MFGLVSLAGLWSGPTLMRLAIQGLRDEGDGYEVRLSRLTIPELYDLLEHAADTHTQTTIHQAIKKNRRKG